MCVFAYEILESVPQRCRSDSGIERYPLLQIDWRLRRNGRQERARERSRSRN
jgi:hypothetical protein